MTIADKLLELNDVKQDIKVAIENKGADLTGVAFAGYAGKIDEIETGGEYFYYSKAYYTKTNNPTLFSNAWEHSLTVDPLGISKAQYPNGETEGVIIPQGVTSIGEYAFYRWTSNNQPLVIPESVTSIGDSAFYRWTSNNQPLVIPESVTSIGDSAFSNWTSNNQPLVIPESVTSIGDGAFSAWTANNHPLVIPESVVSISYVAFGYWEANNQPLVIPDSVTSIGDWAFRDWSLVPYVEMQATTPPTLANACAFEGQNNAPIYVPDESVNAYKAATNWVNLAGRIFPISDKDKRIVELTQAQYDALSVYDNNTYYLIVEV